MSEQDSKVSFFKQSGWMVIATFMGGVLMFGVVLLVGRLLDRESPAWADFYYLIKVVNFLGMPAGGLMLVFAHQTAGAVTDESRRELAVCARGIGLGLVALWCGMLLVVAVFQGAIMEFLDLRSSPALWMTLTIALTSLLTPVIRGLLQGSQKFGPLGWTALSDGAIRFGGALIIILAVSRTAAGALGAALLGQCVALVIGAWAVREMIRPTKAKVDWRKWIRGAAPLVLGSGAIVFFMSADAIFARSLFDAETSKNYIAGHMVGFAMALFVGPIAAVMFPKIVHSKASSKKTDALKWTFALTGVCGGAAALLATFAPWLPDLVISGGEFPAGDALVPWFAWCMLIFTLANVLIGNLLAKSDFRCVGWLVLSAVIYGGVLYLIREPIRGMPPIHAYRFVVSTLMVFNLQLFMIGFIYTWGKHARKPEGGKLDATGDA